MLSLLVFTHRIVAFNPNNNVVVSGTEEGDVFKRILVKHAVRQVEKEALLLLATYALLAIFMLLIAIPCTVNGSFYAFALGFILILEHVAFGSTISVEKRGVVKDLVKVLSKGRDIQIHPPSILVDAMLDTAFSSCLLTLGATTYVTWRYRDYLPQKSIVVLVILASGLLAYAVLTAPRRGFFVRRMRYIRYGSSIPAIYAVPFGILLPLTAYIITHMYGANTLLWRTFRYLIYTVWGLLTLHLILLALLCWLYHRQLAEWIALTAEKFGQNTDTPGRG